MVNIICEEFDLEREISLFEKGCEKTEGKYREVFLWKVDNILYFYNINLIKNFSYSQ
jgi:hypothetical protein